MLRPLVVLLALAAPAAAQTPPDYIDDRSSPERVVTSLYNAINRSEYLRGWSYFRPETAPPYQEFRNGYADTAAVELRLGEVSSEGAAGSIHSAVPVVLQAVAADGQTTVFTGCYRLTQVQPAAQDTPPFRPIQIDGGTLEKSDASFDSATAACGEAE
ncbi:hypothetical protein [Paracoccus sp. S3-43]|uniref:hypothetical protein n=1 Tax=Paracoccus sp. S3-43 TaxID=3030011 RepID=UPI0023B0BB91|nr:hypothetical protein [Paracoccus sp. S3-43]WEF25576.1 hypothetical protein PXD02_06565 [Paracoccus sp. S3-43]